ncbi:MAG: hypothetical protein KGO05_16310, partial [Chloroflexota bacterium]|nr:hypothetical protein [Chloroflexota bacterium]
MSERNDAPRAACAQFAATLAMLDAPDLDPTARAAALAHLAICPYCQADQAADARLAADLRATFGADAPAPFHTADLLAAIGATSEPAPAPRPATQPTASAIRSVVDLGAFGDTGGKDTVNDFGRQTTDRQRRDTHADARRAAPIPSPRSDTRSGWGRWTTPLAAVAVALVVIVVAATLFSLRGRPSGGTGSGPVHTNATATS